MNTNVDPKYNMEDLQTKQIQKEYNNKVQCQLRAKYKSKRQMGKTAIQNATWSIYQTYWLNNECKNEMNNTTKLNQKFLQTQKTEDKDEYNEQKKKLKKRRKDDDSRKLHKKRNQKCLQRCQKYQNRKQRSSMVFQRYKWRVPGSPREIIECYWQYFEELFSVKNERKEDARKQKKIHLQNKSIKSGKN